jgi:AraC family transcriptional regulator, regulatory protein of adaptative response / DNA-3-methyladenine glycosylase II
VQRRLRRSRRPLWRIHKSLAPAVASECVTQLRQLPGIGEWTAQYIAMRELREPDAFPAGDIGLLRALKGADGRSVHPASCWRGPSAGDLGVAYATQHLWATGGAAARERPA